MYRNQLLSLACQLLSLVLFVACPSYSQPEVTGWGNMTGIRIEGQLFKFSSSLVVAGTSWSDISRTAREQQQPSYNREGKKQVIKTSLRNLFSFTETVEETIDGTANVEVQVSASKDTVILGAYFSIKLPAAEYSNSIAEIIGPGEMEMSGTSPAPTNEVLRIAASGIRFRSGTRHIEIISSAVSPIIVRKYDDSGIEILIAIFNGAIKKDQDIQRTFKISTGGGINRDTVEIVINPKITGHKFGGFGGNFRLQNSKTDPQVIEYCLENMRVARARVEMPWSFWEKEEGLNPLDNAGLENPDNHVKDAMELAGRLGKMGIPVIVTAWGAPEWAITGKRSFGPRADGVWGNPLNPAKMDKIYKSITDYLIYLRKHYGVEAEMFSFNESDLGIYVRQTGEEHRQLIKGLGAYFKSRGLKTKLLLGDTADANGWPFLEESIKDPDIYPYIGAVSFHSWRGWEQETLQKWAEAADKVKKPLIVGEGSIDAAAWNYPEIFREQVYILEEINLYIRILAICQPQSILQWQLTADYSPLAGGGIFGDNGPLRPTQRFWNFKQLSSTPSDLSAIPFSSSNMEITCAALGDVKTDTYVIHIVNNGASREATVSGLPGNIKILRQVVTDSSRGMEEIAKLNVVNGQAKFTLGKMSYTTLITGKKR
jgi:hypothetical protein